MTSRSTSSRERMAGMQAGPPGGGANIFREIIGRKFRAFTEDDGALEDVAQFTDVAGPSVGSEHAPGGVREFPADTMMNRGERGQQVIREREKIGAALAERWDGDLQDIKTEEKIFAELA